MPYTATEFSKDGRVRVAYTPSEYWALVYDGWKPGAPASHIPDIAQGPRGLSAYEVAKEAGYAGTEAEWLASLRGPIGPDGKTAYEVAVLSGYTGSMSAWLASLIGPKGDKGDTGIGVPAAGLLALFRNLAYNPTFAVNADGWNAWGVGGGGVASTSREAGVGAVGNGFYRGTITTAPTSSGAFTVSAAVANSPDVIPGTRHSLGAFVRSSKACNVAVGVDMYTRSPLALRSSVNGPTVALPANTWTWVPAPDIPVPALADVARLKVSTIAAEFASLEVGQTIDVDGMMSVTGSILPAYFDGGQAGSRWLGAANTTPSELVQPRQSDIASIAQNAVRWYSGTGSPEGVLTARPGSVYVDDNQTNGAFVWTKRTGTGNTGWKVADGETGDRILADTDLTNGWVMANATTAPHIWRSGNVVSFQGQLTRSSATSPDVFSIPSGFRPIREVQGIAVGASQGSISRVRGIVGTSSRVSINDYAAMTGSIVQVSMTWVTNDAWPSVLPGTAG